MNQVKIAYICNQKKDCGRFGHCQNDCFHTFNNTYSKNGIIKGRHELETDRFKKVMVVDEVTYYEEIL
jgi:hypothetical protein